MIPPPFLPPFTFVEMAPDGGDFLPIATGNAYAVREAGLNRKGIPMTIEDPDELDKVDHDIRVNDLKGVRTAL